MACIEVRTQAELDEALAQLKGGDWIACVGGGRFTARGNSQVTALDNSQVTAWDNSQVTAWDNSHVTARNNSQVTALDNSQVTAAKYVAVHKLSKYAKVKGGVIIEPPPIRTVEDWIDHNGLEVSRGWVTVYKAVADDLKSGYGFEYPIGKTVKCPDFAANGHCGNGLHFCQSPSHAKVYHKTATRFLACKVKVEDAVLIDSSKIKAPAAKVVCEVREFDGKPLDSAADQKGTR